jgi:hypothetical protein
MIYFFCILARLINFSLNRFFICTGLFLQKNPTIFPSIQPKIYRRETFFQNQNYFNEKLVNKLIFNIF